MAKSKRQHKKQEKRVFFDGHLLSCDALIDAAKEGRILERRKRVRRLSSSPGQLYVWILKCVCESPSDSCTGEVFFNFCYDTDNKMCLPCVKKTSGQFLDVLGKLVPKSKFGSFAHLIVAWHIKYRTLVAEIRCKNEGCTNTFLGHHKQSRLDGTCLRCKCDAKREGAYALPWHRLNKRKKELGYKVLMSKKEFQTMREKNKNCFYCGIDVTPNKYSSDKHFLDKLNPRKHYSIDNVVVCCGPCNRTKGRYLTAPEMSVIAHLRNGRPDQAKACIVAMVSMKKVNEMLQAATKSRGSDLSERAHALAVGDMKQNKKAFNV